MKKVIKVLSIALLLLIGLVVIFHRRLFNAADVTRIHFEFRWYSPYDTSYRQQKWTKKWLLL
ncbi:hypothetical protein SB57_10775, partial [Lactobacillus delbrueckii subsp. bulgaricus]